MPEDSSVFKMEIGEVNDRKVFACISENRIWVEVSTALEASNNLTPELARKLASFLEAAANAAENISHRQYTSILSKGSDS